MQVTAPLTTNYTALRNVPFQANPEPSRRGFLKAAAAALAGIGTVLSTPDSAEAFTQRHADYHYGRAHPVRFDVRNHWRVGHQERPAVRLIPVGGGQPSYDGAGFNRRFWNWNIGKIPYQFTHWRHPGEDRRKDRWTIHHR